MQLWRVAENAPKTSQPKNADAFATISRDWPIGVCWNGHLGTTCKEVNGRQSKLEMTVRYLKQMRVVPTSKTSSLHLASLFMDNWIISHGMQTHVLKNCRTQFASKSFESEWISLGTKHLATRMYHIETSVQAWWFNETNFAMLKHYVAEHQEDSDIHV